MLNNDNYSDLRKCKNIVAPPSLAAPRSAVTSVILVPGANPLFLPSAPLALRFLAGRLRRSRIGLFRLILFLVLWLGFLRVGILALVVRLFRFKVQVKMPQF